jgi:hypothetical protein
MLTGYKTYSMLALLIIKALLNWMEITIEDKALSDVVDVLMLIAAGVFKYVGAKRDKAEVPKGYVKES